MGMTGKDNWAGMSGFMDLGEILRGSRSGDPPVWVIDVGYDPPHGANLGGVPPPHGPETHGEAPTTLHGRGVV